MLIEFEGTEHGTPVFIDPEIVGGIVGNGENTAEIFMKSDNNSLTCYAVNENARVCAKRVNDALIAWGVTP